MIAPAPAMLKNGALEQQRAVHRIKQGQAVDRCAAARQRPQRACQTQGHDRRIIAAGSGACAGGDVELCHGSSLRRQDVVTFKEAHQFTGPPFGFAIFSTIFIGDGLGKRLRNQCSVDHLSGPFYGVATSYLYDIKNMSRGEVKNKYTHANVAKQPCQAFNCARSGAESGAMRGRAISARRPARDAWTSARFALSLTPAPIQVKKMTGEFLRHCGPGGVVLSRTGKNRAQNRYPFEIAAFSSRFFGFQLGSLLDARAFVCAIARVWGLEWIDRTIELVEFIYIKEWLASSHLVLRWFCPEPAFPPRDRIGGNGPISNKIGVGYWPLAGEVCSGVRFAAYGGRKGGKSLGFSSGLANRDGRSGAALGGDQEWRKSAVSRLSNRRVGRIMLDGAGLSRRKPCVSDQRHKLSELSSMLGFWDWCRPETARRGWHPPQFSPEPPLTGSRRLLLIWIEVSLGVRARGRNSSAHTGSGKGFAPVVDMFHAGLGCGGARRALRYFKPSRKRAGGAHVNEH